MWISQIYKVFIPLSRPPYNPFCYIFQHPHQPGIMLSTATRTKTFWFGFITVFALILIYYLWAFSQRTSSLQHLALSSTTLSDVKNIAAIIEDRPLTNLVPLLLYFGAVLGPEWPIVLFTTSRDILTHSPNVERALDEGRISIKILPEKINFADRPAITEFLTRPWFWEQLAPAGHVLLFQADSIICANSERRMEDFLSYDFVVAPIDVPASGTAGHGEGYNGGLSLRNRSMILDIINRFSWSGEKGEERISQAGCVTKEPCLKFEDQWFYHKMKEMRANLPTVEVALTFAVETIWYDTPLGYHQVDRWQSNRLDEVEKWCPEYKMAVDLKVKE